MSDYIEPTKLEHFQNGTESLKAYITDKRYLGSFLEAIVSNDLKESVARADDVNITLIPDFVKWLYNNAPIGSWGSKANYVNWLKKEVAGE